MASPNFRPYFRAGRGVTTWLNLMEVYYVLLRDGRSASEAGEVVSPFEPSLLDFSFDDVKGAMELRTRWQGMGRRISYVDAISYYLAQDRHMQFLTGDPAFKRVPGVMFLRMPQG